jgi:uncharacterized protein
MSPQERQILKRLEASVKKAMARAESGHDYWHVKRVAQNSARILKSEKGADAFLTLATAWLHDLKDWKYSGGDALAGPKAAQRLLNRLGVEAARAKAVATMVGQISFKGAGVANEARALEALIVQDADRLDAIGAIGIARCFAYGGARGRALYDPERSPKEHRSFAQYKASQSSSLNHFYEKLLLLKSRMNTKGGRRLAKTRDLLLRKFLKAFLLEWEGKI